MANTVQSRAALARTSRRFYEIYKKHLPTFPRILRNVIISAPYMPFKRVNGKIPVQTIRKSNCRALFYNLYTNQLVAFKDDVVVLIDTDTGNIVKTINLPSGINISTYSGNYIDFDIYKKQYIMDLEFTTCSLLDMEFNTRIDIDFSVFSVLHGRYCKHIHGFITWRRDCIFYTFKLHNISDMMYYGIFDLSTRRHFTYPHHLPSFITKSPIVAMDEKNKRFIFFYDFKIGVLNDDGQNLPYESEKTTANIVLNAIVDSNGFIVIHTWCNILILDPQFEIISSTDVYTFDSKYTQCFAMDKRGTVFMVHDVNTITRYSTTPHLCEFKKDVKEVKEEKPKRKRAKTTKTEIKK
jgi:hypothetical protein